MSVPDSIAVAGGTLRQKQQQGPPKKKESEKALHTLKPHHRRNLTSARLHDSSASRVPRVNRPYLNPVLSSVPSQAQHVRVNLPLSLAPFSPFLFSASPDRRRWLPSAFRLPLLLLHSSAGSRASE